MTLIQPAATPAGSDVARKQIRGSTLLLFGRGLSLVLNLLAQVVTVRYLTKLDYGLFAWAFAVIESAALLCLLGLDKAVMRFAAIYHERQDRARFRGTLLVAFGVSIGLGCLFCAGLILGREILTDAFLLAEPTTEILLYLMLLAPINAFGAVTLAILNVVKGAKAMLFRKHLAAPLLKLAAVVLAVLLEASLSQLALAYLIAGVCGLLLDLSILAKIGKDEDEPIFGNGPLKLPARELLGYSVPLMSSDVMFLVRGSAIVILAGWLSGPSAAAELRTIVPLVRMNELVLMNFALIFIPLASRLLAGNRMAELEQIAQQSSAWVMVICFPIFASCVLLSRPLLGILFGAQYQEAATALIVLTGAYFLDAVFGFSSRVLKVLGLVRIVVIQDIVSVIVALAVGCLLIPHYGAVGAAVAVAVSILLLDLMRMLTLYRRTELRLFRREFFKPLLTTLAAGLALVGLRCLGDPGLLWGSLLVAMTSALVVLINRESLQWDATFPELRRLAVLKRWITKERSA